jgi:hypothetical protein
MTGSLPRAGGILDQKEAHIVRLEAVYRAKMDHEKKLTEQEQKKHGS